MLAEFAVLKASRSDVYPDDAVLLFPSDDGPEDWVESGSVELSGPAVVVRLTVDGFTRLAQEGDLSLELDQLREAVWLNAITLDPTLDEGTRVVVLTPDGRELADEGV